MLFGCKLTLRICQMPYRNRMYRSRGLRIVLLIFIGVFFSMYFLSGMSKDWIMSTYYDHRGYLMSRREENKFNLQEIARTLRLPNQINPTNLADFKKSFFNYVDPKTIIITKQNMKVGEEVGIYFDTTVKIRVDEDFYSLLPDGLPLKKTYSKCSLVGSSGILSGSHCGKQIDGSEFVIRMNAPPLQNFSTDVGLKANLTTMNPSIVSKKYFYLIRKTDKDSFLSKMREFKTYLYIPVFSTPIGFDISVNVAKTIKNISSYPVKPLFMHPDHFLASSKFWKSSGITAERISSGLYMVSVAITLCNEINLFGFWPFHYDHNNKTVDYHYYGQGFVPLPKVHHFAEEFKLLLDLHDRGVLKMHVGTCNEP
ncbi:alpha-N-acetylneuraminide alpha-2,8-sialyltransferase-like [Anneissia japonica]|uniref:alpha-N-acetylneuraminide alpha-2,8-sialyltransferase-like n=1 Tax=Anneissia japonica TaxID=1529436 RepID=UPI001425B04A|nr:alpha-N-acetylneuraminide alpha-2,8-sialyltransferase-like [Anneissia japonica]